MLNTLVFSIDIKLLAFQSDLESRGAQSYSPVHVINLDIQDNHEEATLGAFLICEMCQTVSTLYSYALNCLPWKWGRVGALL